MQYRYAAINEPLTPPIDCGGKPPPAPPAPDPFPGPPEDEPCEKHPTHDTMFAISLDTVEKHLLTATEVRMRMQESAHMMKKQFSYAERYSAPIRAGLGDLTKLFDRKCDMRIIDDIVKDLKIPLGMIERIQDVVKDYPVIFDKPLHEVGFGPRANATPPPPKAKPGKVFPGEAVLSACHATLPCACAHPPRFIPAGSSSP